jgi:TolA-binding protein
MHAWRRQLALLALCGIPALTSGCVTTRSEGQEMRSDIDQLKDEVASLQKAQDDNRALMDDRLAKTVARIQQLEDTLTGLRRADADSGVQLEKVIGELQSLRGELEEARYQLGETRKSVQDIIARPTADAEAVGEATPIKKDAEGKPLAGDVPIPDEKKAHYDLAKKLFDEGKLDAAEAAFEVFTQRHAKDKDLADNAFFWKGEVFFTKAKKSKKTKERQEGYRKAILAYQNILTNYPKSDKIDGALFKIGMSFEGLGFPSDAKVFYEEIVAKHKKSPLAKDAKKRLKKLPKPKKRRR